MSTMIWTIIIMENSGLRENLERASEVLLVKIVKLAYLIVH